MTKSKQYARTRFTADVIKEDIAALDREVAPADTEKARLTLNVNVGEDEWHHDSENEFFAGYRRGTSRATYVGRYDHAVLAVGLVCDETTSVEAEADGRAEIEAVFEKHASGCRLAERRRPDPPPAVFTGHGQSPIWKELKDHLSEKHGYLVHAYEIGARAGRGARDGLEGPLRRS